MQCDAVLPEPSSPLLSDSTSIQADPILTGSGCRVEARLRTVDRARRSAGPVVVPSPVADNRGGNTR